MEDLDFIQVLARRSKQSFEQEHDMASSLGVRGSSESKTRTYALQPHRGCLCLGQPLGQALQPEPRPPPHRL